MSIKTIEVVLEGGMSAVFYRPTLRQALDEVERFCENPGSYKLDPLAGTVEAHACADALEEIPD